jgi:hypothetical protein
LTDVSSTAKNVEDSVKKNSDDIIDKNNIESFITINRYVASSGSINNTNKLYNNSYLSRLYTTLKINHRRKMVIMRAVWMC